MITHYYDPIAGRFTQPDTIIPNPANPQHLNRYTYVRNNPVRYSDPSGRCISCHLGIDAHHVCGLGLLSGCRAVAEYASGARGLHPRLNGGPSVGLVPGLIPAVPTSLGVELAYVGDLTFADAIGQWERVDDVIEIRAGGTLVRVDNALASAVASQNAHSGQVLRGVAAGSEVLGFVGDGVVIWYAYSTGTTPEDRIDRAGRAATSSALTLAGLSALSAGCGTGYLLCVGAAVVGTFAGPAVYDLIIDPALEVTFSTFVQPPLEGLLSAQLGGGAGFDLFGCLTDPFDQC